MDQHKALPGDVVLNLFGSDTVIHAVTREELLHDGVLVDVSAMAREAGFRAPFALTAEVWADCVEWDEQDSVRQCHQDIDGRLWDVLWMARCAVRRAPKASSTPFELLRIPRGGRGHTPKPVTLHLTLTSGDDGSPVFTVLQPGQD
ncbi:DUF6573 family protein [Paraburkholderia tropica]|uniref:DUF6573 family protein n=1 Tax=Paraburkholderia tropica TaxID=92647 RepID=UPI002AB62BE2|nr:DUF6573 family protein [Paraburkholderia tropica]